MTDSIEVTVFEGEESAEEWPSENATMFLLWLQGKLADVHSGYRDKVRIEIGHEWRRGSYIKLSYSRPMTDAEREPKQLRRDRAA
jgi:hypothetical protein